MVLAPFGCWVQSLWGLPSPDMVVATMALFSTLGVVSLLGFSFSPVLSPHMASYVWIL